MVFLQFGVAKQGAAAAVALKLDFALEVLLSVVGSLFLLPPFPFLIGSHAVMRM